MAKTEKKEVSGKNVLEWIKIENKEDSDIIKHLANASKNFNKNDELDVNVLQGIYGIESSYGTNYKKDKKGDKGATGHFQIKKDTGKDLGLTMTKENDERFDLEKSSDAAAKYLKKLDGFFSKEKDLGKGVENVKLGERVTVPVIDSKERLKFDLAAYNVGEGRIARAQQIAKKAGKDPTKWDNVKEFLKKAGSDDVKVNETKNYVKLVLKYKDNFAKNSKAKNSKKEKKEKKEKTSDKGSSKKKSSGGAGSKGGSSSKGSIISRIVGWIKSFFSSFRSSSGKSSSGKSSGSSKGRSSGGGSSGGRSGSGGSRGGGSSGGGSGGGGSGGDFGIGSGG